MASVEDDEEFERIVSREVPLAPLKALLSNATPSMAATLLMMIVGAFRLIMAIYALVVWANWPIRLGVSTIYGSYWFWRGIQAVRGVKRVQAGKNGRLVTPPDPESLVHLTRTPTLQERCGQVARLVLLLGTSILAGIGVTHWLNPIAGMVAGMAFFVVVTVAILKSRGMLYKVLQSLLLMRLVERKNAPEI